MSVTIGFVHVGRWSRPPYSGEWVCADDCPHPSHEKPVEPEDDE